MDDGGRIFGAGCIIQALDQYPICQVELILNLFSNDDERVILQQVLAVEGPNVQYIQMKDFFKR